MPEIADAAASYYPMGIELATICARETIDEWDYSRDPHGYCHDRPVLLALVEEVERQRPDVAAAVRAYFANDEAVS